MFFQVESQVAPVKPETLFKVGDFEFTNSMTSGLLVLLLIAIGSFIISSKIKFIPGKFQSAVESLTEAFFNLVEQISGSRNFAFKILPLVGALFVYIGLSNLLGLIPILSEFTYNGIYFFRTHTSDFNITFGLALAMILLIQIASIRDAGLFGHIGKYLKFKEVYLGFKQGFGKGAMAIVDFIIGT